MNKEHYKTLAEQCLSKYDCGVHICINPYYWQDNGSICGLGDFKLNDVDKLADLLEEVSNQIFEETGDYITGLDWLNVITEDMLLQANRVNEVDDFLSSFAEE